MKEKKISVDGQILNLISQLHHRNNEIFDSAFQSLCSFFSDDHIEFVYGELLRKGDNRSFYWLLRYLVWIERPAGFEKLFKLIQEANEITIIEVRNAVLKISQNARIDLLIRMLELPSLENVLFAVIHLGNSSNVRATMPLISLYESRSEMKIRIEIVKALAKIRDIRCLNHLERWANLSESELQEETLLALSQFAPVLKDKFLKRYLHSNKPRIREIAYKTVARIQKTKWEKEIVKCLQNEKIEPLKVLFVSSLRSIATDPLFSIIFDWAFAPSSKLRMVSRSILRKIKSERILRWLMTKIRDCDTPTNQFAIELLSNYHDPIVFDILKKIFEESRTNLIRESAISHMEFMKDERVFPFLYTQLEKRNIFSQAICKALTGHLDFRKHSDIICALLDKNDSDYSFEIQIVLNFIMRISGSETVPEPVVLKVEKLFSSSSKHIRYLAIRCFGKKNFGKKTDLLIALSNSGEPISRFAANKSLFELISNEPKLTHCLVPHCLRSHHLFSLTYRLLQRVEHAEIDYNEILNLLLIYFQKESSLVKARALALLKQLALTQKNLFFKSLKNVDWSDYERQILLRVLNRTNLSDLMGIDPIFMTNQYPNSTPETKIEFLSFFEHLSERSHEIEDFIVRSFGIEEDRKVKEKVEQVIKTWVQNENEAGLTI